MKNAHLRLGTLEFHKPLKNTTTLVRLHLDRFIGEFGTDGGRAKAFLLSVFGNDQDFGAVWAAISDELLRCPRLVWGVWNYRSEKTPSLSQLHCGPRQKPRHPPLGGIVLGTRVGV